MTSTLLQQLETRQHPQRHNHYSRDDFFNFRPSQGAIYDWNQSRNLLVTEDFIIALQQGLEQEAGEASILLMYNLGKQWGVRDAEHFRTWFVQEFKTAIEVAPLAFMLETWWWPFTSQGWGKWEIDLEAQQAQGFTVINLYDSAVAKTLGNVGKPVCHLYAGLFAGFLSVALKRSLSGLEVQCYGMGEPYCKFMIGMEERVNAAQFWLASGATAKEIVQRLEQGEQ
jgi:predicted hydrocarbon binding protein